VRRLGQLSSNAKAQLADIYVKLAQLQPQDPDALSLLMLVTGSSEAGARAVAQVVLQAARANKARATAGLEPFREDGLMALYVRSAAAAARKLPEQHAVEAFLLGLGMALERDHVPGRFCPIADRFQRDESAAGRRRRLALVGRPTVRGSVELSRHFLESGILAFVANRRIAEAAGIKKETVEGSVGTGFSFPNLAANLAGIQFAQQLRDGRLDLGHIEQGFSISRFVPYVEDLPAGLPIEEVRRKLGNPSDARFRNAIEQLKERVRQLPGYQRLDTPRERRGD
jgi:hypothetical protein